MPRQLAIHRPPTVTKAWRRPNLSLCACIAFAVCFVYPVSTQDHRLATFYGAYQRIKRLPSDTGLTTTLNFKTSALNGLLLAVRLDRDGSNAGYLGIGLVDSHLVTLLSHNSSVDNTSTEFALQTGSWYSLSVRMVDLTIDIELTNGSNFSFSSSLPLSSPLIVRDVFLGGANSFFSPAFTTLGITENFVGCLANSSIYNRDIDFAPKLDGYGMEYGCCPNPEPIAWNFISGHRNSLVFTSRLSHLRFQTNSLTLSFLIQSQHDGMIFYSHDEQTNFSFAVELLNGQLLIHLSNEMDFLNVYFLACDGTVGDNWRHEVEVRVQEDLLVCVVDTRETHLNITFPRLPTDFLTYHIGSANVSTDSTIIHVFQAHLRTPASDGMFPSFGGSLQKFQLNGLEVSPTVLSLTTPSLSTACPHVDALPACQQLQEEVSVAQLAQVSIAASPVSVDENASTLLTGGNFVPHLPEGIIQPGVREAIVNSIRFSVVSYPRHGVLVNLSNPQEVVTEFSYSHLQSRSLAYHHGGKEEPRDSFLLNVTSVCSHVIRHSLTVDVSIYLTNDFPVVTQLGTLSIAVGTRRVISADVISVEDEESPSLISISFRVVSILVNGCGSCGTAGRVEQTSSPGFNSTYFNQKEVNNREVSFQHFEQFGTQPLTISLRVFDSVGALVGVEIPVVPYVGHVTLVRNEPLYIVEGKCAYITADHLGSDTDFNHQNPILQYSVTSGPEHGRLQIQDQGHWRPALGPNVDFEGFTQEDVNLNHVRYCHDNNSLANDVFEFQLHSTLLQGNRGNFTINVFAYARLPRPTVSLATTPVSLPEGGRALLTVDTLAVSLDSSVRVPWSRERIQIESFDIFFRLQALPSFGKIFVDRESMTGTGFSLAQLVEGVVEYRHDDSENCRDSLLVRVEALNAENLPIQTPILPRVTNLSIIISPVNDHTPQIETSSITVSEGRFVTLTPQVLNVTDGDRPLQTITVTIINQDLDHGFFALSDTATPLTEFTTGDLRNGTVYFHHQFNTSLPLSHTITILVSDGERSSQKEIEIEAQPLVIDVSLVPEEECIASLDAVSDSLSTPLLQGPFLSVEIRDEHGTDANRLQNMVLRVARQPLHGDLLLGDSLASVFTLNHLANELVTYRFRNRTNLVSSDSVAIEIGYGHSRPEEVVVNICIEPVPAPDLEHAVVNSISLATDTSVLIENVTFQAVDTRGRGGEAIVYSIVHPPQWGRLVNQTNAILTNFTQADIDQSQVFYQHINQSSTTLRDYFILRLCTLYVCRGEYNITVTFSVTNLTVYNNGMRVTEDGRAYITKDRLDAIAPEGGVRFHISNFPRRGHLYLDAGLLDPYEDPMFFYAQAIASRSVWYTHDGSESLEDSFTFTVTAPNSESISEVFRITVDPVNDNYPLLSRKEFSMIARTTRNITSNDLRAYDDDSDIHSRTLRYEIIYGPRLGFIHYRNTTDPSAALQQWLEDDVRKNRLAYTHTTHLQEESLEIIGVKLYDRDQFKAYFIQIHISKIQLTVTQSKVTVPEGGDRVIDVTYLNAMSDGDNTVTDSDLKFHLTSLPRNGKILLRGQPVTNFTQAELSGTGVVYRHDHSNTVSDAFNYTVTLAQHDARKSGTFRINIQPVDDDAPTLIFHHQPLFVVEGEEINIISEYLEVIDLDTDMTLVTQTNKIEFQIISQPRHGDVWRRQGVASERFRVTEAFTLYEVNHRSVKYVSHPVDERSDIINWFDWFLVNLTDGDNTHETPYNFTFVILPNIVSVRGTPFRVTEGESVIVPGDAIVALHPYLSTQPGCIVINEQPRNGTFVNLATNEENLSNFTTADLKAGRIEYRHNNAEKDKDRVRFTYEAHQPVDPGNNTQPGSFPELFMRTSDVVTLDILINTVNDRSPEIRSGNETTLVMWAEDCAFLSVRHLDVFDADTPNSRLTYTFNFTSVDAYISHINDSNNIQIHTFTQEDVVNSLIKLFHHSGSTGIMYYTVTDSKYSVSGQLNIETHRLEIVVIRNSPLTVPLNGMVTITSQALQVGTSHVNTTISRCFFSEAVKYRFETKYGVIIVDGMSNATSFTDEDLNSGRVFYQHTKPEIWEPLDTLKLKAKAKLTHFKEFELNITIDLPSEPHSPLAVHKSLAVVEGGRTCLNESILDARNIRYNATKESFNNTLTSWFLFFYSEDPHGEILLDGRPAGNTPQVSQDQIARGSVCYQNSGDESTDDPLEFSVIILDSGNYSRGSTPRLTLNVSVMLINDEAPTVASSTLMMPVVEGFSAPVTNGSLLVVDEDNPASDLFFVILSLPPGGFLCFDGKRILQEGERFSQVMVNQGRLKFEASDIGEWTALLSFTDGKFQNVTNFTISIEEHFIKVERTEVLKYSQNEKGAHLTEKHIVTKTNGESNDTVYFLVELPTNGQLKGLRGGHYFTQSDLLSKKVSYIPTNFRAHSDLFKVNVRNREAENSTVTVEVRVEVWGQVKQNIELNFDSMDKGDLSLPLPKNILQLTDLQDRLSYPPIIHVMQQPRLGFLEVKVPTTLRRPRSASATPSNRFTYDFLDYNWVYYTWNTSSNATFENPSEGLHDSFSILVEGYEGIQPGEANITLHIKNPPVITESPVPPTNPPSLSETPTTSTGFVDDSNNGFPTYALLPILGVFVLLLLIILAVIVFCVTQQGRIRKHLQPKMPHHQPLAGRQVHGFPLQPSSNIYNLEPSGEAVTSLNDMTDYRGSHSPSSRHSPLGGMHPPSSAIFPPPAERYHHRHMIPRPRSRRSNVSVSYSHRPLSEVTLDELPRSRHHTFSPPLLAIPNPLMRLGTRCSSVEGGEGESGYLSTPNPSIAAADEPNPSIAAADEPNPSIAADEPVRLVLRRPAVEEVSPLPRDIGDPEEGEEEEGGGGEESCEQQLHEGGEGEMAENVEDREALPDPAAASTDQQDSFPDQEPAQGKEAENENTAHHFNSAHAVCPPPSDQNLPLLPVSRPESSAASAAGNNSHAPSPSDLQTLFRTHNPILKSSEYWV